LSLTDLLVGELSRPFVTLAASRTASSSALVSSFISISDFKGVTVSGLNIIFVRLDLKVVTEAVVANPRPVINLVHLDNSIEVCHNITSLTDQHSDDYDRMVFKFFQFHRSLLGLVFT